ncbi:MAG TPA: transposase family protein [Gammaproteobacteria bacterium]|jgi:hypothetical protein
MLQDHEIERLFAILQLPDAGRDLVRKARIDSPVREVNSRLGNFIVWHFSQKMGERHIKLESRSNEGQAAMLYETDPKVLDFWAQPFQVDLIIKTPDGSGGTRLQHTPDFLIIQGDGFFVHEWRDESRLIRLSNESDNIYKEEGRWHNRAAEEHFEPLGLRYELHSSLELPHVFIQNARFLQDYQLPTCDPVPSEVKAKLRQLLADQGSIHLHELIGKHQISADNVFKCLVKNVVAVDLHSERLDCSSELVIHRDLAIAKLYRRAVVEQSQVLPIPGVGSLATGSCVRYDNTEYHVILVGGGNCLLRDKDGKQITLSVADIEAAFLVGNVEITSPIHREGAPTKTLADLSHKEVERGTRRLEALSAGEASGIPERTLQRWSATTKGALTTLDCIINLAGDDRRKGNRNARLPDRVETLAEEVIRDFFNTPECRTRVAAYLKYHLVCEAEKHVPMHYSTFTKRIKQSGSVRAREGAKKEYQSAHIPLYLDYLFPIHGVRPHDVVYIDHTTATMATVGPRGSGLGKPFLTIATDGHTTQQRAMYLSYDPPSDKVVLMTLRDYVRRQHRLPKILVVDGAKEFKSRSLKRFCERHHIDIRRRPGKPRGGSMVERALGATETEVNAQLEGNTRIMRNTRMVTKAVDPFGRAVWTLPALHGALNEYLFDVREDRTHPTLNVKPKVYERLRNIETGQREHMMVRFDENLMLDTCPFTHRMFHKVDRMRGVWADNAYHWHDDFRAANKGELVEVRVEPWNANIIYVYFRERWLANTRRPCATISLNYQRELSKSQGRHGVGVVPEHARRSGTILGEPFIHFADEACR